MVKSFIHHKHQSPPQEPQESKPTSTTRIKTHKHGLHQPNSTNLRRKHWFVSLLVCLRGCVYVYVYLRKKMMRRRERKKGTKHGINKIMVYTSCSNPAYIYTITIVNVLIYTILKGLMWKIFGTKCVNYFTSCILQTFTSSDADTLIS